MSRVYLAQTDTTVGFLSTSCEKLNQIKARDKTKPCLITTVSFKTLKKLSRVPKKHRKFVRRVKKTTLIYPNKKAIRVVKDSYHKRFLKNFDYLFSTSANRTGKDFDLDFALEKADIVVEDSRGFSQQKASNLIKLSKTIKKKLR